MQRSHGKLRRIEEILSGQDNTMKTNLADYATVSGVILTLSNKSARGCWYWKSQLKTENAVNTPIKSGSICIVQGNDNRDHLKGILLTKTGALLGQTGTIYYKGR